MTWPTMPVRRLFRVVNGGTPTNDAENWGGPVPWATPVDLGEKSGAVHSTRRHLTEIGAKSGSALVPAGSILVSTRAPIGYVAMTATRMAFNQGCRALVAQKETDSRFFAYQLDCLKGELQARGLGTTFLELSSDQLAALPVTVPPLEKQRRIADFLDAETSRISQLASLQKSVQKRLMERESALLDASVDQLYKRAGSIPFRRFIAGMDQGSSPQCDAAPAQEDEWGVLKVSCLRPGAIFLDENKRLPDASTADLRFEIQQGDLLITRANTPGLVGSTAVVPEVRRGLLLSDKIFRVRLDSGIDPNFVACVARGSRIRAMCASVSNGASQSMMNIRSEEIKEWPLPPVDLEAQSALVTRISRNHVQMQDIHSKIDRQLDLLAERRQALITAAVTGQIDVTAAGGVIQN